MLQHYPYGRRREIQVAECLERRGFDRMRSPGSRGPVDLFARRGRPTLAIQVNATRGNSIEYARLSAREESKLLRETRRTGAVHVAAFVVRNEAWFVDVRDGEEFDRVRLRTHKYEYDDER